MTGGTPHFMKPMGLVTPWDPPRPTSNHRIKEGRNDVNGHHLQGLERSFLRRLVILGDVSRDLTISTDV